MRKFKLNSMDGCSIALILKSIEVSSTMFTVPIMTHSANLLALMTLLLPIITPCENTGN